MSGFKNITVSNCNIQRATEDNFRQWYRALPWLGATGTAVLSGIALEAVDGGGYRESIVAPAYYAPASHASFANYAFS